MYSSTQYQQQLKANQLQQQGIAQASNQDLETAVTLWHQALEFYRQIGDSQGEGNTLGNLAIAHHFLGSYDRALDYHQQNLSLEQEISKSQKDSPSFDQRNDEYLYGEYTAARRIGSLRSQGYAWFCLGFTYYWLNDYVQAIDSYRSSLNFTRQINDVPNEVRILAQLGEVYFYLADYIQSIYYHQQAIEKISRISDSSTENLNSKGNSLNSLGNACVKLGDWSQAEQYYQLALEALREAENPNGQGNALSGLGIAYSNQENHLQAISCFEQSLVLFEQIGNRYNCGRIYNLLGQAHYFLGNYTQTIENHQRSLEISKTLGEIYSEERARSELGLALLQSGSFVEAEEQLQSSIGILETIRRKLGSQDDFKISVFDRHPESYQLLQAALIAQSKYNAALEIAERGRARAYVELISQGFTSSTPDLEAIGSPQIEFLQEVAANQQATLVEYSLIQHRGLDCAKLFIWVIAPSGETTFCPVDLASLEQQQTSLSELVLKARNCLGVTDMLLRDATPKRFQCLDYTVEPLQQLYQYLIQPIAHLLPTESNQKVVFIPQGVLFLVPFAALQNPDTAEFLIERHTLLIAPSIQVFALVNQNQNRVQRASLSTSLIVGNPDMPFIEQGKGQSQEKLAALPAAEIEARTIATVLGTDALIGSIATKANIINRLRTARIIHFSTHGLLDEVQQLGTPGAIALTPSENDSGFLTAREILEQFTSSQETLLEAELVVLSACSTGLGRITGDGVVGLSRCFTAAGVPNLVVSLWSVNDLSSTVLMIKFYQELISHGSIAKALRNAQCWLRDVTKEELRDWVESLPVASSTKRELRINLIREIPTAVKPFESPLYWAAFCVLGQGQIAL